MKYLKWILAISVAVILLQTLYFKFTAHPSSVLIFETIGMEPYGRIGSGVVELIASVLILIPASRVYGALLAAGTMSGALFFHLTSLGIEVDQDGGGLFFMAVIVFVCAVVLLWIDRSKLLSVLKSS